MAQESDSCHVSLKTRPHQVDSLDLWWPTALNNRYSWTQPPQTQTFSPLTQQELRKSHQLPSNGSELKEVEMDGEPSFTLTKY